METIKVYFSKDEVGKDLFFEADGYQSALEMLSDNIFNDKKTENYRGWDIVMEDEMGMNVAPVLLMVPLHERKYYLEELGDDPAIEFDVICCRWQLQGNGCFSWYDCQSVDKALKLWKETDDEQHKVC